MKKRQDKNEDTAGGFGSFNLDLGDFKFDLDLGGDDPEFDSRYTKPTQPKRIEPNKLKYANAQDLARDIVIEPYSRYFVIVNGSFYFGDFIEALIVKNNWLIPRLTISTLSLNQNNIDSLALLMEKDYVKKLEVIISDYFFSHERNGLIKYMYKTLDKNDRFQLAVAGTHCKTVCFETANGLSIVMHGSANLRSSGNLEQLAIEESPELYQFNDYYQTRIIRDYATIEKSIRKDPLWRTVTKNKEYNKKPLKPPKDNGKK